MDPIVSPHVTTEDRAIRISNVVFLNVEHGIHIVLGAVLSITALIALAGAVAQLWDSVVSLRGGEVLLVVIDRLLFVLMIAEILHTVRVSIGSGTLNSEPFLIVGLIASIRRVLVITLESSQGTFGSGDHETFQSSMIELGVLAVLILVMVISITLLRRSARNQES